MFFLVFSFSLSLPFRTHQFLLVPSLSQHIWLLFHYLAHCSNVFFACYKRSRHSFCYPLYVQHKQYQAATVAAISSSEVFNASSTLMNYSNEPDIFAADLQKRMPLALRFALLLFPINKCLKCKVACTSISKYSLDCNHITLVVKFARYTNAVYRFCFSANGFWDIQCVALLYFQNHRH